MRRQIRRGVFETNSSSQHSICIMKNNTHYTLEEISEDFYIYDYKWRIYEGDLEFGRSPFRALGNFHDKWLYACASLVKEYNDDIYKQLVELALKYVPDLEEIVVPMKRNSIPNKDCLRNENDVYIQTYGMTEAEFNDYLDKKEKDWDIEVLEYWEDEGGWFYYEAPYTGFVDEDILSDFLDRENISLEEYLTNKKYVVIQDGDEYGYWLDMKKAGLINIDAIDHEYRREY